MAASYINSILLQNCTEYPQAFTYNYLTELLVDTLISSSIKKNLNRSVVHVLECC